MSSDLPRSRAMLLHHLLRCSLARALILGLIPAVVIIMLIVMVFVSLLSILPFVFGIHVRITNDRPAAPLSFTLSDSILLLIDSLPAPKLRSICLGHDLPSRHLSQFPLHSASFL
ncbi:uncharacterized protein MYCGRDRAFT_100838 [Zymoseptoria tritici IPO323]|uniref:Uncharacterized protein n=1 Tax=Zymoseptoria tritici (strain CBS 115943 / IPO323) TaxID=336722 RepID=F9XGM2_ZYMTI|nr:uncharacterized protein MYCGRDRAFT_100838 [Zymoseptoria tritici IPO323]EGP85787.1 hypothetical protein MYCGRDRAFT_100838 [Zymoseptoria tritici IPO323]